MIILYKISCKTKIFESNCFEILQIQKFFLAKIFVSYHEILSQLKFESNSIKTIRIRYFKNETIFFTVFVFICES